MDDRLVALRASWACGCRASPSTFPPTRRTAPFRVEDRSSHRAGGRSRPIGRIAGHPPSVRSCACSGGGRRRGSDTHRTSPAFVTRLWTSAIAAPARARRATDRSVTPTRPTPSGARCGARRPAPIQDSTSDGSNRTSRAIFRYGPRRSSTSRRTNRLVTPSRVASPSMSSKTSASLARSLAATPMPTNGPAGPGGGKFERCGTIADRLARPAWYILGTST